MARVFQFKQFSLQFDHSAHPVGTDAVILGAFSAPRANPTSILDLGTGCGIVALMLAQRFPSARVIGLDSHAGSAEDATINAANSPFHDRVTILHGDVATYQAPPADLIVANPPYFNRQLKAQNDHRNAARHLPHGLQPWIDAVARNLAANGAFWAIAPLELHEEMLPLLHEKNLHLRTRITLSGTPHKAPIRVLGEWRREPGMLQVENHAHRDAAGQWSRWYVEGTEEFYLNLR